MGWWIFGDLLERAAECCDRSVAVVACDGVDCFVGVQAFGRLLHLVLVDIGHWWCIDELGEAFCECGA